MLKFVDTHAHLDGEEFANDLDEVIARAQEAGVTKIFLPAIDVKTTRDVLKLSHQHKDVLYPMIGLHPEEVKADWRTTLQALKSLKTDEFIAVGEVGLDYYWSREFEREQLAALEEQIQWAVEWQLPLMIHCRKAQNELVRLLRHYEHALTGGVFHCFTGNIHEAEELLAFEKFALGIGGVLTFKKSNLPEVLPRIVPIDRIVLETDAPYMAPVPHRGERNESAFTYHVLEKLAESYGLSCPEIAAHTNSTVERIFGIKV